MNTSGGGGGGFSQRATGRFTSDLLRDARRRPPPVNKRNGNMATPVTSSAQNKDDRHVNVPSIGCQARVEFVMRNPLLMVAINRIFDDIVSGGIVFEVLENDKRLDENLSEEQRQRINQQVSDTARTMFIHWIANGFAVLQTLKMAEDTNTSTVVALEPNEYSLSWTKKKGHTRRYEVTSVCGTEVLLQTTLAIHTRPDNFGTAHGRLIEMQEILDIGTGLIRDYYHGFYWGTHPIPATEASASANKNDRAEVMAAPHFVDGDNHNYVEETRDRVMTMHAEEQEAVVGDLMDAQDSAAAETLAMLAQATGMVTDYNPTLEAINHPPFRTILRLGLDRRLSNNVPTPRMDPSMPAIQSYISSLVFGLVGAPPEMRGDVVEKSATETSLLWRYYGNAVRGLQEKMSQFLSLAIREMTVSMFEAMFQDQYDNTSPPKSGEAFEVARRVQRSVNISDRMKRLSVNVRFVHVPTIEPDAVLKLKEQDIISEETGAKYLAAYFGVPMADVLTQEQREKQRKRRQSEEARQAETLATATAVGKGRGESRVEAELPESKRRST